MTTATQKSAKTKKVEELLVDQTTADTPLEGWVPEGVEMTDDELEAIVRELLSEGIALTDPKHAEVLRAYLKISAETKLRQKRRQRDFFFPDEFIPPSKVPFKTAGDNGMPPRDQYEVHVRFFEGGQWHNVRAFMASNRSGKTESGAFELSYHLTGDYPHWWTGKRFKRPVNAMAVGLNSSETRDVPQSKLLGNYALPSAWGTGMIPFENLGKKASMPGITGAIDYVAVKHVSGDWSRLQFRSAEQGREAFQGVELDVIWMDEEPPADVFEEAVLRTMTTNGIVLLTFTPLKGISEVAKMFLPEYREQYGAEEEEFGTGWEGYEPGEDEDEDTDREEDEADEDRSGDGTHADDPTNQSQDEYDDFLDL